MECWPTKESAFPEFHYEETRTGKKIVNYVSSCPNIIDKGKILLSSVRLMIRSEFFKYSPKHQTSLSIKNTKTQQPETVFVP